MPGLITHLLCGQAVFKKQGLSSDIKKIIEKHRKLYNIGCQGPDVFFYYLPTFFRDDVKGIGKRMHREHVADFIKALALGFDSLSSLDSPLKEEAREAALAYFAGFLVHYSMDCAAHPYVYYKTGFPKLSSGELDGKHTAYHLTFESAVDTLLLKYLENKKPHEGKWWQDIKQEAKEVRGVSGIIAGAVNEAYGTALKGRQILCAMDSMSFASRVLRSRYGIWKSILAFFENIILGHGFVSTLVHHQEIGDDVDYLNINKTLWREPWDGASRRYDSFRELFESAANEAADFINALWRHSEGGLSLGTFLKAVGDRSFLSGRPISENVVFKVHDVVYKR
jgi:hypothetical protein